MKTSLSVAHLIELKNLFEHLVKTNKIQYINFAEDIISEEKRLKKLLDYYEMLLTWFNLYDGQIIQTKKQLEYEDIMEAITRPELKRLKYWVSGQKSRLSNKRMQPHEYILLKLSGVEFDSKGKSNPSEQAMLKYIQGSNLQKFVVEEDGQRQIISPKKLVLK